MSRCWFPALALLLAPTVSFAQQTDLEKMLNSIPDVKQAEAPKTEQVAEVEESIDLPTYTSEVRTAILAGWKPNPKWFKKNPNLAAQFLVKINEDGTLKDVKPARLSGHKKFDQAAFDAVWAVGTVRTPPYALIETVGTQGVLITLAAPKP